MLSREVVGHRRKKKRRNGFCIASAGAALQEFKRLLGRTLIAVLCTGLLWNAAAAAATPIVDDPLCAPTNSATGVQFVGTLKMVKRLAAIGKGMNPRDNPYLSDRVAIGIRNELNTTTNIARKAKLYYDLGTQLLQSGQTEEALKEFDRIEDTLAKAGKHLGPNSKIEVQMRRAITMLRLGEQENCLINHNSESCLFPLTPGGFHKLERGSRGAIEIYSQHLAEYPQDLGALWLLNLAYMTLGEYPDKVPPKWLIPPATFNSDYQLPRFPEVAGPLGIDPEDNAGGCILDDFDNDGFIDIVASGWGLNSQLRYYHNDGNGKFTERTRQAGLTGLFGGLNINQTDYNNDGLIDIWVMRGGWLGFAGRIPNSLLRNNGDGTFSDVTEEAGLLSLHPTQTSTWFDYDGDGWLDLFIGNETMDRRNPDPCELYRNNHDGTFTECAALCGLDLKRFVKGVTSADYGNDGRPDLYVSCDDGRNLLFRNDGPADPKSPSPTKWKFTEVAQQAGVTEPIYSFPTWFFDYDNDGWEDLFVSGYKIQSVGDVAADYLKLPHQGALPRLFRNNHDGTFVNVTASAQLNKLCHTMGCNFGDLDNDGWLDFYLGTGDPDYSTLIPNRMFRNDGGKRFQEVTSSGGFGHLQKGHGVGFADLDHDGNQDIYAVMGGAFPGDVYRNAFFLNPGSSNHWVKLKLEGTKSNRVAIGARIKVSVSTPGGQRDIYKTVTSGSSFGANPLRQEIGLGNATAITGVEVFWPASGLRQKLTGLELDHLYHVREGDDKAEVMEHRRIHFDLSAKPMHEHMQHSGM